jgi:hypothetical protein
MVMAIKKAKTKKARVKKAKARNAGRSGTNRDLLRHAVATVAYRGGKAIRGAPDGFSDFRVGDSSRTPGQLLAHLSDLFDWALSMSKGAGKWRSSDPLPWDKDSERFFAALEAFDARLASKTPLACPEERLFQGPVADALTHVGQIAMLRRLAGTPMRSENYFQAEIVAGRAGAKQTAPKMEFD